MERIGVVGCGLMGSGIAEICARAGADVVVIERDESALAQGQARIEKSLHRAVTSGKLPEDEANRARGNLSFSEDFAKLSDRELVIEAVAEDERPENRGLSAPRRRRHRSPGDLGHQHLLDPDHQARHGHEAARTGHRDALLQPGAGVAARRGHLVAPHERRHHRARQRLRQ